MLNRLAPLLCFFLAVPLLCQQTNMQQRVQQRMGKKADWHQQMFDAAVASDKGTPVSRGEIASRDAQQLSAMTASLQEDLQQLQKGVLPKDMHNKLKSIEKLSKKLRQEIER